MSKYGRRIELAIYEYRDSQPSRIKMLVFKEKGRPVFVLRKLIDCFVERGFAGGKSNFLQEIILFGFSKNYWKDLDLYAAITKKLLGHKLEEEKENGVEDNGGQSTK